MRLFTLLLTSLLILAGCSGGKEDDLDRWMKERMSQVKGKIVPLPELKKYEPLMYNADGSLHDPFKARSAADSGRSGGLKPDLSRLKEPLESFPLESLKFVGYLEQGKKSVALIMAPDNAVYQVQVGNYMGQNYGLVTSLSKDEVAIKEMLLDTTGEYVERRVTINPQE
ncbi:MAG TPA: pilus assembly protein PilP [Novimethylophilus sp.]|jgi:type IV pilus assembly protein PilP|uniref:pilus assembly protein PilP n=1 Tax=Novimethylophilus sp. TaxID=2137426 RepID=UPI002F3E5E69